MRFQYVIDAAAFTVTVVALTSAAVPLWPVRSRLQAPLCSRDNRLVALISKQPDFRARVVEIRKGARRPLPDIFARKGTRTRNVVESDKANYRVRLYDGKRAATDIFPNTHTFAAAGINSFILYYPFTNIREIASEPLIECIEDAGEVEVNGHPCIRVRTVLKDGDKGFYYYLAKDLQYLVIRIDGGEGVIRPEVEAYELEDVKFDVSDDLFVVPAGFKRATYRRAPNERLHRSRPDSGR